MIIYHCNNCIVLHFPLHVRRHGTCASNVTEQGRLPSILRRAEGFHRFRNRGETMMNRGKLQNAPYSDALRCRTFSLTVSAKFAACAVAILMAQSAPTVLADAPVYGYVSPTGQVSLTNVPTNERLTTVHRKAPYHSGVANLEVKQAVIRAAQQHHVQPALLLAVMKAESSFNPIAVSKAGAIGLMQLIPETAIRHGVRNLYDANDNITGGPNTCVTS